MLQFHKRRIVRKPGSTFPHDALGRYERNFVLTIRNRQGLQKHLAPAAWSACRFSLTGLQDGLGA
jgi:hypothetical protein